MSTFACDPRWDHFFPLLKAALTDAQWSEIWESYGKEGLSEHQGSDLWLSSLPLYLRQVRGSKGWPDYIHELAFFDWSRHSLEQYCRLPVKFRKPNQEQIWIARHPEIVVHQFDYDVLTVWENWKNKNSFSTPLRHSTILILSVSTDENAVTVQRCEASMAFILDLLKEGPVAAPYFKQALSSPPVLRSPQHWQMVLSQLYRSGVLLGDVSEILKGPKGNLS